MARLRYWDVYRAVRDTVQTVHRQDLENAWNASELSKLGLCCVDSRYRALPLATWELVLAYNGVDRTRYKSEHFDCDNFALCLAGDVSQRWKVNGIGIVLDYSAGHAYNCVLVWEDGEVDLRMVEPQTDQWVHRAVPGYSAQHGWILFT